jgi:ethanolamine utilization protein EutA (predicted chaperonin)
MAGQATTEEDAAARERLAEIRKQIDNLIEAVAEGTAFASLREQLIELGRQEQELKMEAVTLESALNRQASEITIRDDYRWFRNIRDLVGAGSPDEWKMVMRALVRKVDGARKWRESRSRCYPRLSRRTMTVMV